MDSISRTSAQSDRVYHLKVKKLMRDEKWYGYLFILPMVLGFTVFVLVPLIYLFYLSLTDWFLLEKAHFIGFKNYYKLFSQDRIFYNTAINTLYFTACLVPLNIILTLGLAVKMQHKIPGIGFFRTTIFTPVVTSIVVWAVVWKYIFQTDNGVINSFLKLFHITGPQWLYNIKLAIPVVVMVTLIRGLGINMVIFIAALNEVPRMYYEAATIDGASKTSIFWHITLPLISPTIFMITIISIINSMKVFGQIYVMTDGGPGTSTYVFVYYIFQKAFKIYEFGYASSIAIVLFVIILFLTIMQWLGRKRWVFHEQ